MGESPRDMYNQGGFSMRSLQDNFQKYADEKLRGKTNLAVPIGGFDDLINYEKMKLKTYFLAMVCFLVLVAQAKGDLIDDEFSKFSVEIYSGSLHIQKYYTKTDDGWRDDEGKMVDIPHVNFAGKYFVGRHSCGAECSYYSVSDLKMGRDLNFLNMFSSGEDIPARTRDGRRYFTELISRPGSRMLIARYHISASSNRGEQCKEKNLSLMKLLEGLFRSQIILWSVRINRNFGEDGGVIGMRMVAVKTAEGRPACT